MAVQIFGSGSLKFEHQHKEYQRHAALARSCLAKLCSVVRGCGFFEWSLSVLNYEFDFLPGSYKKRMSSFLSENLSVTFDGISGHENSCINYELKILVIRLIIELCLMAVNIIVTPKAIAINTLLFFFHLVFQEVLWNWLVIVVADFAHHIRS